MDRSKTGKTATCSDGSPRRLLPGLFSCAPAATYSQMRMELGLGMALEIVKYGTKCRANTSPWATVFRRLSNQLPSG
jgi:hypothetical protein